MILIEKFHKVEIENNFFHLGKEINLPIWDIVRNDVYFKYYYPEHERKRFEQIQKHSILDYFFLLKEAFLFIFKLFFQKGEIIVFSASRYIDADGQYFDKSAQAVIDCYEKSAIIIEPILRKNTKNQYVYDFSNVLRKFRKISILNQQDYDNLNVALTKEFGECLITLKDLNLILSNFTSDVRFYRWYFKLNKIKTIFICTGNPKAQIQAAKSLGIKTYLMQHASIEQDSAEYSYPLEININSRVLFSDVVLTYSDFWCKTINVPTKEIISIGNDYFLNPINATFDGSILVISTIIHGDILKALTMDYAKKHKDVKIIYKLHPNEFSFFNNYKSYFKDCANVSVISDEVDTSVLIEKCKIVVLIVSTVLYEALNKNKKVAVLKLLNYERQLHLNNLNNIYFFDNISELDTIIKKPTLNKSIDFYKKTDTELIKKLFL